MEFEQFSRRRWEQWRKVSTDKYQKAEDDYFCWRWCKRQFSLDLDGGIIPSDELILQSIFSKDCFFRFHIDYLYSTNDPPNMSFMGRMLGVYGDDPEKLASMWEWAKSSGAVSRSARLWMGLPKGPPSLNAFYNQLQQDATNLGISQASGGFLRPSLSAFLANQYSKTMKELVEFRLEALGVFDFPESDCDVSFLETTRATPRSTEKFSNVSIQCSVAGSGKTQQVFNQLYQNWGHYLVSGRVPSEASPDFFLTARHGMASLDTSYLCKLLGKNPDIQVYYRCLEILIENRQKTLRRALTICSDRRYGIFRPCHWLLFQTVCTRDFDPFLETFKLALLCNRLDGDESIKPLYSIEMFCFDEVQCEMNSEQTYSDEPQALDAFLNIFRGMNQNALETNLRLVLAGTSLQLTQCIRRVEDAGLNYATLERGLSSQSPWQLVTKHPEIFDLFDSVSNYDGFHELMHNHFKRLIDQACYLTTLPSEIVGKYRLWEIFMPDNQSLPKEKIYRALEALLRSAGREGQNAPDELLSIFVVMIGCCPDRLGTSSSMNELLRRSSAMFRGRFRWSTLFIEHLFIEHLFIELLRRMSIFLEENVPSHRLQLVAYGIYTHISNEDIKCVAKLVNKYSEVILQEQSELVQNKIKEQLKYRIGTLQQRGHHYLLEDLYATAVRADLMHKPCIFRNLESAQMVTEGFALLQPSTTDDSELKQELAEPLAVDAVIEYLRRPENEMKHRYERYLQELLYHNQDDDSAFGKVTEFYIGWAFGGLLLHQDSIFQISPRRRYELLSALGDADLIHRFSDLQQAGKYKLGPLDDYTLEQSSSRGVDGIALGSKIEFHQWLQCIWKGNFFPTFYFPSNIAGPDIVFCLRHQKNRNKRLICAIQVKTGTTKVTGEDSFKLVRTLDPNLWFEGQYQEQRKRLIEELRSHSSDLRILTILVVTSLEVKKFFASREDLHIGLARLQEPVCRYSMLFEEAMGNTQIQNIQDKYKIAEKAIEKVINNFLKQTTVKVMQEIVEAAKTVITSEKGSNLRATKETTIIRQALTFSQDQFRTRLVQGMVETGIPHQREGDTIDQFINAYNERERTKNAQKETLQHAKERLEETAVLIPSKVVIDDQHANPGNLSCNTVLDFFFTVLERDNLKIILGEAFDELIRAMKGLEQRKIVKAANSSESESDDKKADKGEDYAETGPRKRSQSPDLPTNTRKKQCVFHSAPSENGDTPMS